MTYSLPSGLEDSLRRLAREQGRSVEEVIAEVLSRALGNSHPANGNGNSGATRRSLKGTVLKYDDPYGPAVPDSDWEALG